MIVIIILAVMARIDMVQSLVGPLAEAVERKREKIRDPARTPSHSSGRLRRPKTPPTPFGSLRRRHLIAPFRSVSEHVDRLRTSLPPNTPRHLGRSSHLHPLRSHRQQTSSAPEYSQSADEVSEMGVEDADVDIDDNLARHLQKARDGFVPSM